MINRHSDFAQVCRRMETLMGEQPTVTQRVTTPRLDEIIQRLAAISAEQRAA